MFGKGDQVRSEKNSDRNVYRRFLPLLRPYRARAGARGERTRSPPDRRAHLAPEDPDRHGAARPPSGLAASRRRGVRGNRGRARRDRLRGHARERMGRAHVVQDLRAQLYSALQHRSMRYFHRQRLGDLLTPSHGRYRVDRGFAGLRTDLDRLVLRDDRALPHAAAGSQSGLVLVAATILPVLAVATVIEARRGRRAQQEIRQRTSELTSTAEEGLSAIALVKAFARGEHEERRFGQASERSAQARCVPSGCAPSSRRCPSWSPRSVPRSWSGSGLGRCSPAS